MSNEDSKPIGRRRSLGIKGRILSSSLAIVAFILLVGAAGLYGLRLANNDFVKYQVLAEQTNVLSRVQANILEAQLAGKNFVLQGKTDSIQIVEDRAATARQYIQDTEALFEDPHAHDTIVLMGDQFEEYRSKFQEVTVLQKEIDGLVAELETLGPSMEQDLTGIMTAAFDDGDATSAYWAGTALRHLLLAKVHATNFLVKNEASAAQLADNEISAFEGDSQTLRGLLKNPDAIKYAQHVVDTMGAYHKTFTAVTEAIDRRNALTSDIFNSLGPLVAAEAEELKLVNKDQQDLVGPRVKRDIALATTLMGIVAVIGVLIGVIVAFFTARSLVRPINSMTTAMTTLAD
ncbi:MAG: hypothetical protein AAGC83_13860, partial [Pseudomonadota bacterium]